jgi:hypothetical protein
MTQACRNQLIVDGPTEETILLNDYYVTLCHLSIFLVYDLMDVFFVLETRAYYQ